MKSDGGELLNWTKFGDFNDKRLMHRLAKRNFEYNSAVGISAKDCVTVINSKKLLRAQKLGSFPMMKLSKAKLSDTCCEVIATYNALKLCGRVCDDESFKDFFKLCSEFVVNALLLLPSGHFGSNPFKIKNCLSAYSQPFTKISKLSEFEEKMKDGDVAIVSFRHHFFCIHTFCVVKQGEKLISINRGGSCDYEWKNDTLSDCLRKNRFLVGYILKNT